MFSRNQLTALCFHLFSWWAFSRIRSLAHQATLAHPLEHERPSVIEYFFKDISYQIECFSSNVFAMKIEFEFQFNGQSPFER